MKIRNAGILMLAVLFISVSAMAQKPAKPINREAAKTMVRERGMRPGNQDAPFLTAEQKEVIKKLRLETEKQMKPLKNELRELTAHQQTLMTADKADLNAINKNIDKISGVKAEMAKIRAKQHQEFRSQLTEEQLIKFDSRKGKMRHATPRPERGDRMERHNFKGNGSNS